MIVVDATDAVAGRLATFVAKKLIQKEQVVIVNAEKAVISGNPDQVIGVYFKRRGMTNKANPEKAAKWPRRPDFFLKKIIFGMLPKTNRRKQLLRELKIHIGVPEGVKDAKNYTKTTEKLGRKYISILDICQALGWNKQVN